MLLMNSVFRLLALSLVACLTELFLGFAEAAAFVAQRQIGCFEAAGQLGLAAVEPPQSHHKQGEQDDHTTADPCYGLPQLLV